MTLKEHINRFRVRHSFKICLASMICVIISTFWHLQDPFFSVITVLLIMGLYADHAVVKGVERFIGSFIGVVLGILFSDLSFELPPIYFISLTVSLLICMYFFAENRLAYAAIQCAIMISVTMISAGELLKLDLGIPIHRLIGIGVGVIISWLVL
ncbi:MAG TPA: FUSC family protein, partial [Thermodesulfobacteriota bacterium]